MNTTLRLTAALLSLAGAALAQDPAASTGGSTVAGAGAGTSAPVREDVKPPAFEPPIAPAALGGLSTNGSAVTATGTGSVANVTPGGTTVTPIVATNAPNLTNASVAVNNGNATVFTNTNSGVVLFGTNTNVSNGLPIVPPASPVLTNPSGAALPAVRPANTGPGNGPGLPAGGVAPSGPRIEPAMTSSGTAGTVVPSGPRVETLPTAGAPTTSAPTR